jgi:hypothetical protein
VSNSNITLFKVVQTGSLLLTPELYGELKINLPKSLYNLFLHLLDSKKITQDTLDIGFELVLTN